jgi:peptide/nickel transport system substrate-binding protein
MKRRSLFAASLSLSLAMMAGGTAHAQTANNKVLRFVPHANLTVLDPIWTTAYVTRNHAYMIYDTLFTEDAKGQIKPQMVESYQISKDEKTWTFKLRAGLEFHDGKPVTSADVVASLKRWASRDAMGGVLATFITEYQTPDANTFKLILNQPCGIVLDAFGKASSNVPFIMPARIAATPGTEQIKEHIGSGPFVFKADEFKPGALVVYTKNAKYKSRPEAPSAMAGGRPVNFDRVEWVIIRDTQTQFNALKAGEVDIIEQPSFEQMDALKKTEGVRVENYAPAGMQFIMRFNHLHAPFNNPKIRQAAMVAMGQQAYINTQVGVPELGRLCRSMFPCGTTYSDEETGYFTGVANPAKAKQMLQEAGYDGTPVTLMRPTDLASIAKLPLVAQQQLQAAGFKVDFQQMDWATLLARRAKKDAPAQGGWNIFLTAWTAGDITNPLSMAMLNAKGQNGWFGWQDEPRLEYLKGRFARTTEAAEKKKIASEIQRVAFETATHAPLGQYISPAAVRSNVSGMLITPGVPLLWNMKKN